VSFGAMIAAVLPQPSREKVGAGGNYNSLCLVIGVCVLFALISAAVAAGDAEERWRIYEGDNEVFLSITTTEGGTDDFGSPYFQCRRGSGTIQVGGTAKQDLRAAIADVIRADEYPLLHVFPIDSGDVSLLSFSYSEMRGWQYGFELPAIGRSFDEFKRTGQLTFKVGTTVVTEEFNTGLESAARFQDICKQPPKAMRERSN
jgi:hypothetical protein